MVESVSQYLEGLTTLLEPMLKDNHQDEPELVCYNCRQVLTVWSTYRPLIQKALDRGSNYTIDDILEGLCSSAMQLWTWGEKAAMVTTLQFDDDKKWCLLLALGGEGMDQWKKYLPVVEDWARTKECDELRIYGRLGWKKLGFDFEYAKLVRTI